MNNSAVYSHLGGGIGFPLNLNVQGGIAISSGDRNIRESIQIILGTKLGERVYRPDFGCRLSELTFAPMNQQTLLLARVFVKDALTQWEPRIKVDAVLAEPDPVKGKLDLRIIYRIKDTHDQRSMVYPFYLLPPN
jgi:phage baseplate assembly protein W